VALWTFLGRILAPLFWGIYGNIPTKVAGKGIFLRKGGLFDVVSLGNGRLAQLHVKVGETVTNGQWVATVGRPDLERKVEVYRANLDRYQAEQDKLKQSIEASKIAQTKYRSEQKANYQEMITNFSDEIKWLADKVQIQEKLVTQGLLTKTFLLQTKSSLYTTQQQLAKTRTDITQLDVQNISEERDFEQTLFNNQIRINDTKGQLLETVSELDLTSRVVSFYSGIVVEIMNDNGKTIGAGDPVISLQALDKKIDALVYVSADEGKRVLPGMRALIGPSTIKQEEYGYIVGKVRSVATFPSTSNGMLAVLENKELVAALLKQGPPLAVYIDMEEDPLTVSGFHWTSRQGPNMSIDSGTPCQGFMVVEEQPPIRLAIPKIKKFLGL
jgi:HlyD family secretion protein